jgi:hypothetical protein
MTAVLVSLSVFFGSFTYNQKFLIQFKLQWKNQKN